MQYQALLLPLNTPTRSGRIFTREQVQGAFDRLNKRINDGEPVEGEFGSPPPMRLYNVGSDRLGVTKEHVCLKVVAVELRDDGIYGTIEPVGRFGAMMVKEIESDWNNQPTLSARMLSRPHLDNTEVNEVVKLAAFDFVAAKKPVSPSAGVGPHIRAIIAAMVADPMYAWSWYCNLKMPHVDAGANWTTASHGAANFLSILTGGEVDITKHPLWAEDLKNSTERDAGIAAEAADRFPEVPSHRNVMNIIVEAPAHHGGQMVATAVGQLLGKVLPNTPIHTRMGDWDEKTHQSHVEAIGNAIENGQLDIDNWNKDSVDGREFEVVVKMRPNRILRFDKRLKD